MKKLYTLLLAVGLCVVGNAQMVKFAPLWKKGDAFKYFYFKNKYNPKNTAYKADQDTVVISFNITKADATGYTIAVQYDYSKSLPPLSPLEGLKKIAHDVKQTTIELSLDTLGNFVGLNNWQELKKRCEAKLDEGKKLAKDEEKGTWDYWRTKLQTKEQIEKLLADDFDFFFMIYGSELMRNTKFDYEDEIKSPFNANFLPANTNLETVDDADNANLVEVKMFTLPDSKKAAETLKQYRELARQQEDDPKAIPEADLFDLQDYYVFLYNIQTGHNQLTMYLRYLKTGSKELIESYKFMLVP